jgi:hydrogenase 3 maturation protease
LTDRLEGRLKGATRIAVLGVGSELRSDDVAGILAADGLRRACPDRSDLLVAMGYSAPENLTGPIIGFKPSHLVVVDCAELGAPPGTIRLFPIEDIGGVSSSTHSLPLKVIFGYLSRSCPCEIIVVGIQPKSLKFDGKPSREALAAAEAVSLALTRAVRAMDRPSGGGGPR